MDLQWQVRLTLGTNDEGVPVATVEKSHLDGSAHDLLGRMLPGHTWTVTDLDPSRWPGRLVIRLESLEDTGDHPEHTPS